MKTAAVASALIASACLFSPLARAQSAEELASRRLMIDQATSAASAGDHGRALELAERAQRIQSTPSIRLFIASRQEALARYVAALGTADQCVREATRDTMVPNRQALIEQCTALRDRARAHVGVLELHISGSAPSGLAVTINDVPVSEALIGAPQLVQEGPARIAASAPGFVRWERSITVRPAQTESVEISLARRTDVGDGGPVATNAIRATTTMVPPVRTRIERRGPGAGPWVVVGVGAATLALSGVFFALRGGALANCTVSAEEILCDTPGQVQRVIDEAYTYNALTNVSIGVGAAMVAGGVLWFALAPRRDVEVTVAGAGRDGAGLSVRGRF